MMVPSLVGPTFSKMFPPQLTARATWKTKARIDATDFPNINVFHRHFGDELLHADDLFDVDVPPVSPFSVNGQRVLPLAALEDARVKPVWAGEETPVPQPGAIAPPGGENLPHLNQS